jgi:hypothetical protein
MKPRRSKHRWEDEDHIDDDEPRERRPRSTKHAKRSPGKRRNLLVFLLLAAIVVGLLPMIVAKTSLRNAVLTAAVPTDKLHIVAGSASLGWFSAPSLAQVTVRDAAGDTLFTAESIRIDRTPASLVFNSRDLGIIEILRPAIHVKLRDDGSNVEDALRRAFSDVAADSNQSTPTDSSAPPVEVALQVVEGTVFVEDTTSGGRWRVQTLNLQYDTHGTIGGLGRGQLSGEIEDVAADGAVLAKAGQFALASQPADGNKYQLKLQADAVSLALATPWLNRLVSGMELGGTLSGEGTAIWTPNATAFPSDLTTSGSLSIDRFDAATPTLAGDRIRLARVDLPWRLAAQPGGMAIEDLQLLSDVGQLGVRGTIDSTALANSLSNDRQAVDVLAGHDVELRGSLDLVRLAAMLPHALRIREGTTINSGSIKLAARSQPDDGGQLLTGSLQSTQLAATASGRVVRWDQPINANFALRRKKGILRLDTLKCASDFLQIEASGTPQQLHAAAQFDLNRLAEQLGQFIDVRAVTLAGTGAAQLDWQQSAPDKFTATAAGQLQQLHLALGDGSEWSEPQLAVHATAAGALDSDTLQPNRVETAQIALQGNGDALAAQLTEVVILTDQMAIWPFQVRATGQLAHWLTRVRPWFAPDPWHVDGRCEVTATIRIAGETIDVTSGKFVAADLRANGPGWNINEPQAELTGDARWNGATGELAANRAQFVTSAVAFLAQDVRYRTPQQNSAPLSVGQVTGMAAFRTDLARLATWRAAAQQPPTYRPGGELTGNARFQREADRLSGEITVNGQNLTLAQWNSAQQGTTPGSTVGSAGYKTIWQEPQLAMRSLVAYESASDRVSVDQFQIQSNTLAAAATGHLDKLSTAADIQVNGTLNYDLAQITPLLAPYLGTGIQLSGREQAQFVVAGQLGASGGTPAQYTGAIVNDPYRAGGSTPGSSLQESGRLRHWSRRLEGRLEVPWAGANVYGLPISAGRLAAALDDGMIRVEPLNLDVGEGQLTAAPIVRLDPQPSELTLSRGPLITHVRISTEVSDAMLKYVAPVLAGATRSEGQFSLALEGARVPLGEPKRADSAGQLTVHSVRVAPGPMAQHWVGLAQQIEALVKRRNPGGQTNPSQVTLLSIRDQQVNFRVADGRVHHQNMEFQVGDVTLRSQGSVGFDETVALTLSVPVQDDWIAKEPLLAGFKGQALQIPIGGTLMRPQMDQRAIASITQQLLQGAAQQAIGGELNKALDKLFKPR